jgi:hypothetical protein
MIMDVTTIGDHAMCPNTYVPNIKAAVITDIAEAHVRDSFATSTASQSSLSKTMALSNFKQQTALIGPMIEVNIPNIPNATGSYILVNSGDSATDAS